jgi:hypothetical protein
VIPKESVPVGALRVLEDLNRDNLVTQKRIGQLV